MVSAKTALVLASAVVAVSASHKFTLVNKCSGTKSISIDNWSGTAYTGAQPPDLASGASWSTTIPNGWDGRLCDHRNCWGSFSMSEFNLDASGLSYYDISNIEGFSVGQKIVAAGGDTQECKAASCPCTSAYGVGNTAGTCAGSSTPDRAVRATGTANAAFTITYCPA
ncbi:Osmotin, thaumatin-like protein [Clavulina sp. PMI_390]|nr:Osmotin, thaumatin-like protein [Clavulina sp. PMI_390]